MEELHKNETWVDNLCYKFETFWHGLEEFKEPAAYYDRVGDSVKKFCSDAVEDILRPLSLHPVQDIAQIIPSKFVDLVEAPTSSVVATKENYVDSNTNKSKESPLVPRELRKELLTDSPCLSEKITSEVSGYPVGEGDGLIKKTSNNDIQVQLNSCTESQEDVGSPKHKNSSESFMYFASSETNASASEGEAWGMPFIVDQSLAIDKKIEDDSLMNSKEKKTLLNRFIDETECYSNTSTTHQSSELESWICCSENKEETAGHVFGGVLVTENCDDGHFVKISHGSIENHLDNRSEEDGILCNASSETSASVFEDADWGIVGDMDLCIDKKREENPLISLREKKTLLNTSNDKSECDTNASITHQSSELESSVTCNEDKEKKQSLIFFGGLLHEKLYDSSNSSFGSFSVEPDTIDYNGTTLVDYLSTSSHGVSTCGSFSVSGSDSNNEASTMCCSDYGLANGSSIDFEDLKMDAVHSPAKKQLVKSCVSVESEKPLEFPSKRSKSYKKIIKDAFMSKKKLAKEYIQLPVLYVDIDNDLSKPTDENTQKSPAQDSPYSEWELL